MTRAELRAACDPFGSDPRKHPGRPVGLGLPFLAQGARLSGGGWRARSTKGAGTAIAAWFDLRAADAQPEGDAPGLFRLVLSLEGPREIVVRRRRAIAGAPDLDYALRKSEAEAALGGLDGAAALALLGDYIKSLEGELNE